MKFERMYSNVYYAWVENTELLVSNPNQYWKSLTNYFMVRSVKKEPVPYFRWHVGGDIPDSEYLLRMTAMAALFPETRFLAFTKKYDIVQNLAWLPDNLRIVLSAWPGLALPENPKYPVAWFRDPDQPDPRIPLNAMKCPDGCSQCHLCWRLKDNQSVVFEKH